MVTIHFYCMEKSSLDMLEKLLWNTEEKTPMFKSEGFFGG